MKSNLKLLTAFFGIIILLASCKGDKANIPTSDEEIDKAIEQDIDSLNQDLDTTKKEIDALLEDI